MVVYEMEYTGKPTSTNRIELIPFCDELYPQYEQVYNECFYEMRKALNIKPNNFYSDISQLRNKKHGIFLLMDNDIIIGSVGCFATEIDDLIVNKRYQRQGYGSLLLNWAVSHIREYSAAPITLHVAEWNQNAVNLYTQNGFSVKHRDNVG